MKFASQTHWTVGILIIVSNRFSLIPTNSSRSACSKTLRALRNIMPTEISVFKADLPNADPQFAIVVSSVPLSIAEQLHVELWETVEDAIGEARHQRWELFLENEGGPIINAIDIATCLNETALLHLSTNAPLENGEANLPGLGQTSDSVAFFLFKLLESDPELTAYTEETLNKYLEENLSLYPPPIRATIPAAAALRISPGFTEEIIDNGFFELLDSHLKLLLIDPSAEYLEPYLRIIRSSAEFLAPALAMVEKEFSYAGDTVEILFSLDGGEPFLESAWMIGGLSAMAANGSHTFHISELPGDCHKSFILVAALKHVELVLQGERFTHDDKTWEGLINSLADRLKEDFLALPKFTGVLFS